MQLPLKMLSQSRRGCCSWIFFIIALSIFYLYNIANVGWQLVHYTVYGTRKSDNGLGLVDSPPSNICIIYAPSTCQSYSLVCHHSLYGMCVLYRPIFPYKFQGDATLAIGPFGSPGTCIVNYTPPELCRAVFRHWASPPRPCCHEGPSSPYVWPRGGSRNFLRGGGGVLGQNSSKGGFRVQVRGNFHILISKKKNPLKGGLNPLNPPPLWISYWCL